MVRIYLFLCDIICSCIATGDWVERSYTPILPLTGDCNNEGSEVELMVKLYKNGAMSSILSSICIGMYQLHHLYTSIAV